MKRYLGFFFFVAAISFSCEHLPISRGNQAENVVDSFSHAYFLYQFERAMTFTTDESHKWLVYAASNVHQEDLDIMRSQKTSTSVEVEEVEAPENDTVGYAVVSINNYLVMDTIGEAGHIRDNVLYRLDMVKRGGKWKIKMDGLPKEMKR
ncbi:MAG: hypothetical protein IKT00_14100 [Prevotella sp.]|nr:hypothetical protein [Prevotella sp.]